MVARLILKYPDERLRGFSEPVYLEDWEKNVPQWCQDLHDTMVANAGLGLAGPQIGIKKQIFAIDIKELDNPSAFQQEPKDGVIFIINPVVSLIEKENHGSIEACLSVPGAMYKVKRSPVIGLFYMTPERVGVQTRIIGEDAVIVQHENDHLLGKLFVDYLNSIDRKEFNKLFEKPKQEMSEGQITHLREQKRAKARANRKKK